MRCVNDKCLNLSRLVVDGYYLLVLHLVVSVEFLMTGLTQHFAKKLRSVFKHQVWVILFVCALAFGLDVRKKKVEARFYF